ncbi:MAG: chromate resistance protein [Treponema sp. GWB1_62_6]|nr:MAG: chromate resistance protein [Treponema sp. GWB1_62_6]OHE65527.1 MAG: chromate resistance protein [Treponema sp. GWC1_61_84]OHE65624.1 MAG: chromate resistance protein [Treponema sp. GWA1_62_8]OHE72667.1 MAG: chromate resistance protein [Treponema sp. RIFOXYC1_FULL_61_9]HCM27730.1 chromate resistance protein [Treponema sp.]
MKWVTRSHVHVDRVACPWLIKRFVDSEAEFIFVPAARVGETAAERGATPFDSPGVELGHHGGDCSFQTIVKVYGLTDPALGILAGIVGCADTGRLADHPVAAGLEALAVGYSLRFPDDAENLAKQFEVYDSLYAWCRLQTASAR